MTNKQFGYHKAVKESINWLKPELLAISEHVFVRGGYTSRQGMLRQLMMDKALALGVIDKREHELLSMIAHDTSRGSDYETK